MTSEDSRVRRLQEECAALRQELAQAKSDSLFAEALESSSEAIVIYDADGLLVTCNQNFRDLYGYSREEAGPGVHFAELGRIDIERGNVVVGDEYGGGEAYLKRKAEYRRKLTGSFIVRLKDGRWIKTVDRPMSRGGFVSVQVDITDIKKNEQALRQAKELAEEASRLKSEFLANISHDLRTPLNSIIGFSEMILREAWGPIGNDKYREYVDAIKYSGDLLLSLVGDILNTAKLESGRYDFQDREVDLHRLAQMLVRNFSPVALEKNLAITVTAARDFPEKVKTDERVVAQIINNLVANACKHTQASGAVTVAWRQAPDGRVCLVVSDNGPGMSQKLVEKIGEPFLHEGPYVTEDSERGTGLGLYICTRFAAAMGGTLAVESEQGKGTSVTVEWPAETVQSASVTVADDAPEATIAEPHPVSKKARSSVAG